MNFYRRFPGDYLRDTLNLTWLQDCAYSRLLDHQYSTESPIECLEHAQRIARAVLPTELEAVAYVYGKYFPGGVNKRFGEELKLAELRRNKAVTAANSLWNKCSKHAPSIASSNAPSMPSQTPDSRLPDKEKVKVFPPAKTAGVKGTDEFSIFWEAYPKKLGKQEATRAWIKRGCEGRLGDILASLKAWKDVEWREREFIPYPATWLNADRWKETPVGQKGGIDERELERIRALRR